MTATAFSPQEWAVLTGPLRLKSARKHDRHSLNVAELLKEESCERVLWENTAVRVYSLYERRLAEIETPCIRQRCAEDFDWLLNRAEPALFGLDYNPLQRFRRAPSQLNGREVRLRRTCCLSYKTTDPLAYCGNCPLLRRSTSP